MNFDWSNVVLTTVFSGAANLAIWFVFKRQIDRQDQRIHDQDLELRDMRDKRMAHFEAKLEEKMGKAGCLAVHAAIEKRLDQGGEDFRAIRDDISIIRSGQERNTGLLEHVLKNMGLHMIGNEERPKR